MPAFASLPKPPSSVAGDSANSQHRLPSRRAFLIGALSCAVGCTLTKPKIQTPIAQAEFDESLVILSDLPLSVQRSLTDDLASLRSSISKRLNLPASEKPITVRLFSTEAEYEQYMHEQHPEFPARRALFVEDGDRLTIYASWGEQVAEDLRHEITHGCLHAVVPNIPLWLDEGLAEFFEVPEDANGMNRRHAELLSQLAQQQQWRPNIKRLEAITEPAELAQTDYAEGWLWVHFFLQTSPGRRETLQTLLAKTRASDTTPALANDVLNSEPDVNGEIFRHLQNLAGAAN
ncbi:MAG: DUF1570 domain-containing protein [bacterium]|nr:DUF1570 domain-containing protein [bacterium]